MEKDNTEKKPNLFNSLREPLLFAGMSPCKDCNHREVSVNHNCHSNCKLYQEWKARINQAKRNEREDKILYSAQFGNNFR